MKAINTPIVLLLLMLGLLSSLAADAAHSEAKKAIAATCNLDVDVQMRKPHRFHEDSTTVSLRVGEGYIEDETSEDETGSEETEIFENVEEALRNKSMLPFSYFITPLSTEKGSDWVMLGVYRRNRMLPGGKELVWMAEGSLTGEGLGLEFEYTSFRPLKVSIECFGD